WISHAQFQAGDSLGHQMLPGNPQIQWRGQLVCSSENEHSQARENKEKPENRSYTHRSPPLIEITNRQFTPVCSSLGIVQPARLSSVQVHIPSRFPFPA